MRVNPGGRLRIEDIVGRDGEISRYWTILARQGLVLSAKRRIGKTHIALKMRDECPEEYLPFYQDLEGVHSVRELIRSIYRTVDTVLSGIAKFRGRLAKWSTFAPQRIGDIDLPSAQQNWQELLALAFDDLVQIADDKTLLMMWDEFPLMIYNIQKREGEDTAIELLDHLRRLRQLHSDRLRFLFTGSIGLHLVLRALQKAGNANDPVNDMYSTSVSPMSLSDTVMLATLLLTELEVDRESIPSLSQQIAVEIGGFPYYIHHVVDQLHQLDRPVTKDDVSSAIDNLLHAPQDPANFFYYVSRLSTYYDDTEQRISLAILDCIAADSSPKAFEQIVNLVRHQAPSVQEEEIRKVLQLLIEDHYLTRTKKQQEMRYDFRWNLVKQWWKDNRL